MDRIEEATFGAGCFWCIEACYKALDGVLDVYPGYAGGHTLNPSYKEVCTGSTNHAEVVRVLFDPEKVSFTQLLEVFFFVHDPTQFNRQGNDIGTQYRSVIFFHSAEQESLAKQTIKKLTHEQLWAKPIVTQVESINTFYRAEDYHHDYLELNPENSYCQFVVRPKYEKFKRVFAEILKSN
jgi:peptide-methionine (S)-S-oxide reductase